MNAKIPTRKSGKAEKAGRLFYEVVRELEFCYGHRLLDYEGKCANIHGHNGKAVIVLGGRNLGENGILLDFAEIKSKIQGWIEDNLDHALLLCDKDPLVEILSGAGLKLFVMDTNPTAENIARTILEKSRQMGLPALEVRLWETEHCHARCRIEGDFFEDILF